MADVSNTLLPLSLAVAKRQAVAKRLIQPAPSFEQSLVIGFAAYASQDVQAADGAGQATEAVTGLIFGLRKIDLPSMG